MSHIILFIEMSNLQKNITLVFHMLPTLLLASVLFNFLNNADIG